MVLKDPEARFCRETDASLQPADSSSLTANVAGLPAVRMCIFTKNTWGAAGPRTFALERQASVNRYAVASKLEMKTRL